MVFSSILMTVILLFVNSHLKKKNKEKSYPEEDRKSARSWFVIVEHIIYKKQKQNLYDKFHFWTRDLVCKIMYLLIFKVPRVWQRMVAGIIFI